ncbi:hypothetical protein FNF27_03252 [Cafeteria roenbergensis]|uniref:RRM domain-containing protein n=2 Tax=Cafeteria roenbergensis TaxID=33653 RepID=A0A5A8EDG0_CAFRO|nr:hypothetical protein FNF27_03252 [Cafeteria roenbergensis]
MFTKSGTATWGDDAAEDSHSAAPPRPVVPTVAGPVKPPVQLSPPPPHPRAAPAREAQPAVAADAVDDDEAALEAIVPTTGPFRIMVASLPNSVTPDALMEFFSRAGRVLDTFVVRNRETGQPRGVAFVEMSNRQEMKEALKLDGEMLCGRPAMLTVAEPRPSRGGDRDHGNPRRGGGFGGPRGGDRDRGSDFRPRRGGQQPAPKEPMGERPKLVMAKRTVAGPIGGLADTEARSSVFGSARPADPTVVAKSIEAAEALNKPAPRASGKAAGTRGTRGKPAEGKPAEGKPAAAEGADAAAPAPAAKADAPATAAPAARKGGERRGAPAGGRRGNAAPGTRGATASGAGASGEIVATGRRNNRRRRGAGKEDTVSAPRAAPSMTSTFAALDDSSDDEAAGDASSGSDEE